MVAAARVVFVVEGVRERQAQDLARLVEAKQEGAGAVAVASASRRLKGPLEKPM